jgi:formylmethanofuran dehydrogenase subunit A
MVDKATYPLLGDWWQVLEHLSSGKTEELAKHVAWLITATKGYAIKIVNPGGLEAWGFGRNVRSLDEQVPNFCVTPREILRGLAKVNRLLNLPHTIHVHTNNLGQPGNYVTTLETMDCVKDLVIDEKPSIHVTHCQFSAFKGEDWRTLDSGAEEIANYVNCHSHVTLDMGQIVFADTTTMTADGPFQFGLHRITGNKWVNHDVETETSAGIVPFHYKRRSYVHAVQWSIGLELALLIKNPWGIFLTTDHPNAGPFTSYPKIISWLMSRKARDATLRKTNARARSRSLLPSIDRELSFSEVAVMTRAGQAKALGLGQKGHLGVGADADIAVYPFNPEKTDSSRRFRTLRRAFEQAAYTIKNGQIVVKNGKVKKHVAGDTLWLDIEVAAPLGITDDVKERFREYWTVEYENYPVNESQVRSSCPIALKAGV